MQLIAALTVALVFLILQLHVRPHKRPGDNLFGMLANVALVFAFLSSMLVECDELVDQMHEYMGAALLSKFKIQEGPAVAVLIICSSFVFVASVYPNRSAPASSAATCVPGANTHDERAGGPTSHS